MTRRRIGSNLTPMEKRQLGKTDMHVSVLGFGGAEIGYEGATPETVRSLLNSALDEGLNVIDTAECYESSEQIDRRHDQRSTRSILSIHKSRPPTRDRPRRLVY